MSPPSRRFAVLLLDLDDSLHIALPVVRGLSMVPGIRVEVLSGKRKTPIRLSRAVSRFHWLGESNSADDILEILHRLIRERGIDVLLPAADRDVDFFSRYGDALSQACSVGPVPGLADLETAGDKLRLAEYMLGKNMPAPPTVACTSLNDCRESFTQVRMPALLKPLRSGGGRGIIRVADAGEALKALEARPELVGASMLQSFVSGYDIDCSVLYVGGRVQAATVQRGIIVGTTPFGPPAGIEFLRNDEVSKTTDLLLASLHWNGVAHLDMRFDVESRDYKVLEINPRFWRSLLGSVHAGVNFPYLTCLTALGVPFSPPEPRPGRFIHENRIALRSLSGHLSGSGSISWRDTSLAYAWKDPLPELAILMRQDRRQTDDLRRQDEPSQMKALTDDPMGGSVPP